MSYELPQFQVPNFTASADLSTHQFKPVKLSGVGTVTVCAAITDVAIGILQNKPTNGQEAVVMCHGISKCVAGAAITAGAELSPAATAIGVITAATTSRAFAHAAETAGGAADIIAVLLLGSSRILP